MKQMRKQLRGCALLALSVLLFAGGCHKEKETVTGDPKSWVGFAGSSAPVLVGHTVKPSELSATEIRYGIAPKRGPGVTYQDGIILMEHGDKAITAFASDGMSWTFDANAPQARSCSPPTAVPAKSSPCNGTATKLRSSLGQCS